MDALHTNVLDSVISENTENDESTVDDKNITNLAKSDKPLCNAATTNDTSMNNDHPNHDLNLIETVESPSKLIATASNTNDSDQNRRSSSFSTAHKTKSISTDIANGLVWKFIEDSKEGKLTGTQKNYWKKSSTTVFTPPNPGLKPTDQSTGP